MRTATIGDWHRFQSLEIVDINWHKPIPDYQKEHYAVTIRSLYDTEWNKSLLDAARWLALQTIPGDRREKTTRTVRTFKAGPCWYVTFQVRFRDERPLHHD